MDCVEEISDGYHSPREVVFKYVKNSYIPIFAETNIGQPYSGKASGSFEIADWFGSYRNGYPDGEFRLILGDRQQSTITFNNGVTVRDA